MPSLRRKTIAVMFLSAAGAAAAGGYADAHQAARSVAPPAARATQTTRSVAARGARAPASKRSAAAVVKTSRSRYGRILVDGHGRTLYLFTHDRPRTSRCFGACASAWPPFYTRATVRAGGAAHGSLVGSIKRGKRRQVTYAGHPLYYYVGDRSPGLILCQAVSEYGGLWYVVAPSGAAIR